jgi:hypothetical protein
MTDTTKVAFGISSGGDDPRSTNETFDDTFSTKDARINHAFVEWKAADWLTVKGGKIEKVPWFRVNDLMWDGDINPEGVALNFEGGNDLKGFFNTGYFFLNEWKTSFSGNPSMIVLQPGMNWKFGNGDLKIGLAYYIFDELQGNPPLVHSSGTNTIGDIDKNLDGTIDADANEEGLLLYEYDSYAVDMTLGFKLEGPVPYFGVFANYVNNSDPDRENTGYLAGIHFGDKKVKKRGQWLVKALFRSLERDAWLDLFPDSDALEGFTGIEGPEIMIQFGLAKNISFGIDYYMMEKIKELPDEPTIERNILQLDLLWKF